MAATLELQNPHRLSIPHPIELTIVLKDAERTYRHKFLLYEDVLLHPEASVIQSCIKEAKESFRAEPEDIIIQAKMIIQ